MEVVPGVYQLKSQLFPGRDVNSYLIRGKNGLTLIDTGFETQEALAALERELGELKLSLENISQIIITHAHPDHCGLVSELKRRTKAKVAMHELEAVSLDLQSKITRREIEHLSRRAGIPEDIAPEFIEALFLSKKISPNLPPPEIVLHGGEIISTGYFDFEVLWTPGHSPGHVCLYESRKKILLAGDHILPITTPIISFYPPGLSKNPLADYINSLKAMKNLKISLVLPGHEHIFENFWERIEELLNHHEIRKASILEILLDEPKSAYEIATRITWAPQFGGVEWRDLNFVDKFFAISETLAHLEALKIDGKIREKIQDQIDFYTIKNKPTEIENNFS